MSEPCFDTAQLAHVELLTPKIDASLEFFTDVLGMCVTERAGQSVYLRGFEESYHHSLKLTEAKEAGLGHMALRTSSPEALARRVAAVEATGLGDGWTTGDVGHGDAYAFRTPDGHRTELFWDVERATIPATERTGLRNRPQRRPISGVPIRRLDHVNLLAADVSTSNDFLIDALGFRLREEIRTADGGQRAVWLSVSNLVHEIAIMEDGLGARGRLHHTCFWYGSHQHLEDVADLMLDRDDILVEVGPGVHGVTRAKFLYVREPGGNRIELFGDTGYLILEPDWPTVTWGPDDVDVVGTWIGPVLPDPDYYLYATPPLPIPGADVPPAVEDPRSPVPASPTGAAVDVASYTPGEAREWAREDMVGICGCLLPTLNASLTDINESAIRHDVRLSREFGYWGTLLVPETGTTEDEFRRVIDIAVDEAQGVGLRTILMTAFPTLEMSLSMVRYAEAAGVDMVMPSYPATFYPSSEDEVFDYTKALADASGLAMMLFTIHHWNFARLHPSGFSPRLMNRLLDEVPTVAAIKNEIGLPGVGGIGEVFQRFADRVVVSDPFEQNAPAWVGAYGMRFLGTANYEYAGPKVAEYFAALVAGDLDRGMEIYWQIHPARQANIQLTAEYMAGSNLINRLVWKYQGWLTGFNGGPVRPPAPRISDTQMHTARAALERSGIVPAPGADADFFVGRNPED